MGQSRNIVIVGGVAGGMSCAARLRRLDEDARIVLIEKGPYVSYANCGIPYALGGVIKSEAKLHVMTIEKAKAWFNIEIHVNTELLRIDRSGKTIQVKSESTDTPEIIAYDKLVLALGAESFRPPIKGIDSPHVFTLQTIPQLRQIDSFITQTVPKSQHAVVIGGGFIGLETTENLIYRGMSVTLLEAAPHVMPTMDADMAEPLHKEIRRNGVRLMTGVNIVDIVASSDNQPAYVTVRNTQEITIPADLVIVATGVRPRTAIADQAGLQISKGGVTVNKHMQTSDPDIYAVGDMIASPHLISGTDMNLSLAGPANRQGRLAADHICGRDTKYRGNVGTAVCKVFDQTAGTVGFSNEMLKRLGKTFDYVTVHPPDHAGYYPGAVPLTMRVAFEVPSGALLGAQIVGQKGVDKRIDVLAMAMRAGMTIEDLEHVELSYAPPYGSAKDPVNMAGFCASNVLNKDVNIIHAEDLASGSRKPEDLEIIDVRSPEEFQQDRFKAAKNIPLNNLRERIREIRGTTQVLVYCRVGYRGYLASRILKQKGFDVYNLDGGLQTISEGGYDSLYEKGSRH
ncbi:hypothetical protein jhhlp_007771 [Lomentospora prolificans]|uniref:Rhodanese domain-containing protein n=1 Tax=Lomentospora prolificans TaxID=41688 RepID=A0A2N3N0H9_9PEZI|nr:hypothetical protein jhhlp_007771 [Lomentospora prolificans]